MGEDAAMQAPSIRWVRLTLDCRDAEAMAAFYARLFGWEVVPHDGPGWVQVRDPADGVGLNLQADPTYAPPTWPEEPGVQAKMMHFEVLVDDVDAAVAVVLEAGGTQAPHQPADRNPSRLRVMLDPAGHPFCLFVAGE